MGKIIQFDDSATSYVALGEKFIDNEKYEEALKYLFCALKKEKSERVYGLIASAYSEMGLFEQSNRFWIKCLDKMNEEDFGDVYEELGINYFYMDNFLLSSYYFNKKISKDGCLKREDLSDEILDYFTESYESDKLFKVVYPLEKADFSEDLKLGRSMMANGDFAGAIKTFKKIPVGAKEYYESLDELSLVYFLKGEFLKAIELNKKIIDENGENISVLCNLSSMYTLQGNEDKALYYYKKATEYTAVNDREELKIATCALEVKDHNKAIKYLEKIIKERPYEINIKYLLGLSYINVYDYKKARRVFYELYSIMPYNLTYGYYLKLSDKLISGDSEAGKMLPLTYEDNVSKSDATQIKKRIDKYLRRNAVSLRKVLDTESFYFDVQWAFKYGDEESCKKVAFILTTVNSDKAMEIVFDLLTDSDVRDSAKGGLLFSLIINGYKGVVGISCSNFYNRLKIKKVSFQDEENMGELFLGYALLMTKLAFVEIDDFNKVYFALNKVYKRFKNTDELNVFTREELACLILYLCAYQRFKSNKEIAKNFRVKEERLQELIKIYGEKND